MPIRGLGRLRPYVDTTIHVPVRTAVAMTLIECAGIGLLFWVFLVSGADESHIRALLAPPILTFVLAFVTAKGPASRPGRILACYAVVGAISILVATIAPFSPHANALIACGLGLFAMHALGLFHPPAVAVCVLAPLTGFTWAEAGVDYVVLMLFVALALALVFVAQRVFVDPKYPDAWY